ncbi:MAG: hypothetical protein IPP96_12135 [Chitinophagaceae bacterium]|nr:hypothetical protein [Chitinophagaceae bacterium]
MKKSIPGIALLCISVFMINSCATTQNSVVQPKPEKEDASLASVYVIKTDGSTQQYSSLKLVTGVLVTPHLLADGKIVIYPKDVLAYQDGRRYAVSQKLLKTEKTSFVAAETLPGFAVRIAKGKLNVYSRKYYNGNVAVTEYFLQSGDEGEIVAYSPATMKELIKDNNRAADYYNSKVKISPKSKKLMVTADLYNNPDQYVSKN